MIVKILSSAASFSGVKYNTNKIDKDIGELLMVKNFGPLQMMDHVRPEDYINYLKMISAQNKNIKKPQFHVAISAKGKSHSKDELTVIAEKWMALMGYAKQPYLVIFHSDTNNNHVHIVSARVQKNGVKISSAYERTRAIQNLNKIMGLDIELQANADLENAMTYNFHTKAQFKMILERLGYQLIDNKSSIELLKSNKRLIEISHESINSRISDHISNTSRIKQLKQIFIKYGQIHDTTLKFKILRSPSGTEKVSNVYTSEFAEFLKQNLNIELIYHAKNGQVPYAYSILDHTTKNAFKGSEILRLKSLEGFTVKQAEIPSLNSAKIQENQGSSVITNSQIDWEDFADPAPRQEPLTNSGLTDRTVNAHEFHANSPEININIAVDIDDEAIHGRNRRRQKKAQTNSR